MLERMDGAMKFFGHNADSSQGVGVYCVSGHLLVGKHGFSIF